MQCGEAAPSVDLIQGRIPDAIRKKREQMRRQGRDGNDLQRLVLQEPIHQLFLYRWLVRPTPQRQLRKTRFLRGNK